MSRKTKIWIGVGLYLLITIGLLIVLGNEGKNDAFQPQNEFKLDPWIEINIAGIDLSINKAVFYLALASALTIGTMCFIASRMQREPNKVQMAVEIAYDLTRNNITGGNIPDDRLAKKWFPFLGTLFFFIFFSNMIGFLPLPINTEHTIDIFGLELPTFALYAATANLSVPLVLALVVWFSYHVEGIRAKGFFGYLKSWLPPGLEDMNPAAKTFIFVIEAVSQFARLISLSVRLVRQYPRRPPAAAVHGRRARGPAGSRGAGAAHIPARVLLLHPRGWPDRHPPGVHLLHAYSHLPRRGDRRDSLKGVIENGFAAHRPGRAER